MSEEAAAAPVTEVAPTAVTEATPAAPPPEPEAPKPPPTSEFQALARTKAKLLKAEQALKQRDSEFTSKAAELAAREEKLAGMFAALDKFDDDPEAVLQAFAKTKGVDAQHFFNTLVTKLAHKGEPPDPVSEVQKLREEMAAREAAKQKEAETAAEKQRAESMAAGKKYVEDFLAADPDKYERIAERLTSDTGREEIHNHLMQMADWYKKKGEDLTLEQAGQNLEAWYESQDRDRLVRLLGSKKLAPPEPRATNESATPTKPAEPAPAEQAAPPPQTTKSLPKSIPTGRATVPVAGGRAVQRKDSQDMQDRVRWAAMLAEANKKKAG